MKKVMFAAAAIAAGVAMADVTSANVVGYLNRDLNNKFKMAAVQFVQCGGEEVAINEVVNCPESAAVQCWDDDWWSYDHTADWDVTAPQIQVPKVVGTGYNYYYYYVTDARSSEDDENLGIGWADTSGYLTADTIPAGFGIWIRGFTNGDEEVADTAFSFAGAVSGAATETVSAENVFKLRSVPFPIDAALNEGIADWTVLTPVQCWDDDWWSYDHTADWDVTAPQIQVPKVAGTGYNYYYYVTDARSSEDDENLGIGWVDTSGYLTADTIPAGFGIWINARSEEQVDIPFSLKK